MLNWQPCRNERSLIICSIRRIRLAEASGFTAAEWQKLADALLRLARENEIVETEMTPHGRRYVVDGLLTAPDGTGLNVRTAWYINSVGDAPRFVTAHPLPKL
jgi:hypothetical protein